MRGIAATLPRSQEALVGDRIKFRVGRIVYLAFSRDEQLLGFAFPREERAALVDSEPEKYALPGKNDMRFNWAVARLGALSPGELTEIVLSAWEMVVPGRVADERLSDGS